MQVKKLFRSVSDKCCIWKHGVIIVCASVFAFSTLPVFASQTGWLGINQFKAIEKQLRNDGQRPTKIACLYDRETKGHQFSVKYKKERGRKREWLMLAKRSLLHDINKYGKLGYRLVSSHNVAGGGKIPNIQCAIFLKS